MANAKRRRTRDTVDDEFNLLLSTAVAQLLPARHIEPGDNWHFYVDGSGEEAELIIVRSRSTATTPDPES
jgi:hypothetical protein